MVKKKRKLIKKPELIPDWKKAWRFWSMRLAALGTAITSLLILWPDAALQAWNLLPQDLKSVLPERMVPIIGVGIFILSMVARVINQPKLNTPPFTSNDQQPPSE